jgi:hypothetical protein
MVRNVSPSREPSGAPGFEGRYLMTWFAVLLGRVRAAAWSAGTTARAAVTGLPVWTASLAIIAVCVLGWRGLGMVRDYLNPPPPMVSVDAIRAAQERDRANRMEAAARQALDTLARREKEAAEALVIESALIAENARLRGLTVGRETVVLPDDDAWLNAWRGTHP